MPFFLTVVFLLSFSHPLSGTPIGVVIPVADYLGVQRSVDMTIGNPPQRFAFLIDSGSAAFWVPSVDCYSVTCWVHNTYIHAASSTFRRNDTSVAYAYESGNCNGFFSQDGVTVGPLSVANVTFAEMKVVPQQFLHSPFDGVLGLGWNTAASNGVPAFLSAMVAQGLISDPSYSLFFPDGDSILVLGGLPPIGASEFTYHPIQKPGLWSVSLGEITIDSPPAPSAQRLSLKSVNNSLQFTNATLVIDSSVPGILADPATMQFIAERIVLNGCDYNQMPDFGIKSPSFQSILQVTSVNYVILTTLNGKSICTSAFQAAVLPLPYDHYIVLGVPFLKANPVHFDFVTKSLGLLAP